ncbi:MAG: hypothetical protein Q9204_001887 [Flavoplaca sp. TL-2023a]
MASRLDRDTRLTTEEKAQIKYHAMHTITRWQTSLDHNFKRFVFKEGKATVSEKDMRSHMSRYIVTDEEKKDWTVKMEDYYRLKKLEREGFLIGS